MKKRILVPAILGVMGIGGAFAVYGDQLIGSANNDNVLTLEQIEQKALKEVNGTIQDIEFERNVMTSYYDVEVATADAEYDLKFDANTGKLLVKNKDWLDFDDRYEDDFEKNTAISQNTSTVTTNSTNVANTQATSKVLQPQEKVAVVQKTPTAQPSIQNVTPSKPVPVSQVAAISQEQAIQIALAKVNGTVTSVELDDNYKYEIEVVLNYFEYDFDIDSSTGAILKLEKDGLDD